MGFIWRIKILKKEGLDEANISVDLYVASNNVDEDLGGVKAQTYNLENGKIEIGFKSTEKY